MSSVIKPNAKRLVLFDIDGTILWGGPLWKECFIGALNHYFPNFNFPTISFNGKTDVQICNEMMEQSGLNPMQVQESMEKVIEEYIKRALVELKTRANEVKVLPGVVPLLENLVKRNDVIVSLLTGNVQRGARMKLASVGLHHHFDYEVATFGDDHFDRYKLPPLARDRAKSRHSRSFVGKEIVIIGDTIHDVNCGKSIGVRSIAVGTGRNVNREELLASQPDFFFNDLAETPEVLSAIFEELG